jgi:hypothetical protein
MVTDLIKGEVDGIEEHCARRYKARPKIIKKFDRTGAENCGLLREERNGSKLVNVVKHQRIDFPPHRQEEMMKGLWTIYP